MYTKLFNTFSDAWSLWWQSDKITQDRFMLTIFIGVLAVLWFLLIFVKKPNKNPPLPPGPKGLPLVGNLLALDPELHTYFASLAQTYGPIYTLKLGKKIGIVVSSPALAKEVLKDQDTTFANRDVPVAGREATYGGLDIVWTPYGPEWRMLRKVCVREMLSHNSLDSVYALRRRELRQAIKYLYGRAGSPVNVGEQMFLAVLNVITSMMWGGTVSGEERAGLGAEFKQVVGEMTELLGMPNLSDFYPGLERFDLQGVQKKMKGLAQRFDKIFETIIEQRLKMSGKESSKDFLQFLLQLKDEGDAKTPLTMTHVKALLMKIDKKSKISNRVAIKQQEWNSYDGYGGGRDGHNSQHDRVRFGRDYEQAEVLNKVRQELETVVGRDNIVEETDINKLPYLYTVMKEVLRLHPALPLLVPHCPSATCTVAQYVIPKGARVFVNVWAIHRDPSIWENPMEFCPERFSDSKWDYSGNDFKYFPFGSGRRICAGTAMAERMFMYSLASLVHSFDWSLPAGERLDLSEKFGIVLKKKIPLVAIPTPRLPNPSLYE
ncbi:UNVERIFIED_CONTAM: Flavonoid 3'-monooxygenase [Sesamum radiatum]|uniref:Flavonoid 3'-monooxygenase n=1 Tax=Sesamum radiatum TaxID=300843 RepID=A0AAW2L1S4_SESRA